MRKPDARQSITAARVELLLKQPFFGTLALCLLPVTAAGICGTAATDGKALYSDPDNVDSLSREECVCLVAHEVMHCALGHLWRRRDRDRERWNIAIDFAVNGALADAGFAMPAQGLFDPKLKDMCAEEVYARLSAGAYYSRNDVHLEPSDYVPGQEVVSGQNAALWEHRARHALSAARG